MCSSDLGKRISRITGNEFHLQLLSVGKVAEVDIDFGEIVEMQVRHKDQKG